MPASPALASFCALVYSNKKNYVPKVAGGAMSIQSRPFPLEGLKAEGWGFRGGGRLQRRAIKSRLGDAGRCRGCRMLPYCTIDGGSCEKMRLVWREGV